MTTTPATQAPDEYDPEFVEAWAAQEDAGYIYSESNIAKVYFGWQLARQSQSAAGMLEAINEALIFYDALGLPHAPGEAEVLDKLDQARRQAHSLPGDALREALADIFAAWDAHVEANERTNAAIPDITTATRAEYAVYDERYRVSEEAKREWYRAMHRFIDNPATRAALTPSALSGDAGEGRVWPAALTQGLREILGIPNFQCGPMAHAYQKIGEFSGSDGLALDKRAEDEQAFILHKLVSFWFEHGDGWREPAIDEIDRAAKLARAAHQGAGE